MPATSTEAPGETPSSWVHPAALKAPKPGTLVLPPAREERRGSPAALLGRLARLGHGLLHSRVGLVLMAAAVVAGGLALGWEWLAIAGILPLVLSILPCVAMCALGLCMMKGGNDKSFHPRRRRRYGLGQTGF